MPIYSPVTVDPNTDYPPSSRCPLFVDSNGYLQLIGVRSNQLILFSSVDNGVTWTASLSGIFISNISSIDYDINAAKTAIRIAYVPNGGNTLHLATVVISTLAWFDLDSTYVVSAKTSSVQQSISMRLISSTGQWLILFSPSSLDITSGTTIVARTGYTLLAGTFSAVTACGLIGGTVTDGDCLAASTIATATYVQMFTLITRPSSAPTLIAQSFTIATSTLNPSQQWNLNDGWIDSNTLVSTAWDGTNVWVCAVNQKTTYPSPFNTYGPGSFTIFRLADAMILSPSNTDINNFSGFNQIQNASLAVSGGIFYVMVAHLNAAKNAGAFDLIYGSATQSVPFTAFTDQFVANQLVTTALVFILVGTGIGNFPYLIVGANMPTLQFSDGALKPSTVYQITAANVLPFA